MRRFYERSLLYDPTRSAMAKRVASIIGTSFGHHRGDREKFHAHSEETLALFRDPLRRL